MEFDVEQQPPTHMPIVYGLLNKKKPKKRNQEECEESKDVCDYKCIECSKRIKVQPVFLKAAIFFLYPLRHVRSSWKEKGVEYKVAKMKCFPF